MRNKIFFLLLIVLPPCSFSKDMVVFLNPKQSQFSFELKSNPTTGYRWSVFKYSKVFFALKDSSYKQSQPMLIGSGGYQTFVFNVQNPDQKIDQWISMKYARPWEPKTGLIQRIHIMSK